VLFRGGNLEEFNMGFANRTAGQQFMGLLLILLSELVRQLFKECLSRERGRVAIES